MSKPGVKISFGEESFVLNCALIGGTLDNIIDSPISMYGGPIDLEQLHSTLYYANRAVLKVLMDEFGIPLDKTDDFLVSAMSEALVKEYNMRASGTADMDYERRVHYYDDNQN